MKKLKRLFDFIEIKEVRNMFFRVDIVKFDSYEGMLWSRRKIREYIRENMKDYELEDVDTRYDHNGELVSCSLYYIKAE